MRNTYKRYRLKLVNIVYWFLLLYIIAGLMRWFIVLDRQSQKITQYELGQVRMDVDSAKAPRPFTNAISQVYDHQKMRSIGYIGEGGTFLVVIMLGALFIGRVVRRQMRLSDQQQNFMMAVTHELKTPIAAAKLSLETLIKRKLTEEQQTKLIKSALSETERLNQLSDNILLASRLEDAGYATASEEILFSSLVDRVVRAFKERFPQRALQSAVEEGLTLHGDPLLLELAVNNVIENALKYSPKEAPVWVRLVKEQKETVLKIIDEGEGIPDHEKSLIFRKFYRVGMEQTRKTKGTGLGLYLSRAIIRKHHGQITVQDNKPRGSIFTITFYT